MVTPRTIPTRAEIRRQDALVVMAIGHCSTCAGGAVHCMHLEDLGVPTAPLVTSARRWQAVTRKAGMPGLRFPSAASGGRQAAGSAARLRAGR